MGRPWGQITLSGWGLICCTQTAVAGQWAGPGLLSWIVASPPTHAVTGVSPPAVRASRWVLDYGARPWIKVRDRMLWLDWGWAPSGPCCPHCCSQTPSQATTAGYCSSYGTTGVGLAALPQEHRSWGQTVPIRWGLEPSHCGQIEASAATSRSHCALVP